MALGDRPTGSALPLLRDSDWIRPRPSQVRALSKVFALIRLPAGLAVLGLAALLVQSSWKPGVVFLILWVSAYDGLALFVFFRGSDTAVIRAARAVGLADAISFFVMLWTFGPNPPGALIACYIALLNVAVSTDGIVGAGVSAGLFVAGYSALGVLRNRVVGTAVDVSDIVLWTVVVVIIAISLASIQRALVLIPADERRPRVLPDPEFHLSPREREVLQLVSEGYSNTMIATRLHLSDNTVKGYVEALLTRLNARNRAEAVAAASRLKLL